MMRYNVEWDVKRNLVISAIHYENSNRRDIDYVCALSTQAPPLLLLSLLGMFVMFYSFYLLIPVSH